MFVILEPLLTIFFILAPEDYVDVDYTFEIIFSAAILLMLFIFFYIKMIKNPYDTFDRCIEYLKNEDLLEYAIRDLQNGHTKFNDMVVLGETCIIGKKLGVIIPYSEISRVYIKLTRFNVQTIFTAPRRYLAVDVGGTSYIGGTTYCLCYLKTNTHFAREWNEMGDQIHEIAPQIIIQ